MKKIKRRDGSEAIVSDDYIIANGESFTVPMQLMDSRRMVHDGRGNVAGCRPGFLYNDSDTDVAVLETVHREYRDDIEARWQSDRWSKPPVSPVSDNFVGKPSAPLHADAVEQAHAQYRRDISERWRG